MWRLQALTDRKGQQSVRFCFSFPQSFLTLATYYETVLKIETKTQNFPSPAKWIKEVSKRRHSWNPCQQVHTTWTKEPTQCTRLFNRLEAAKPVIWISVGLITPPITSEHSSSTFICRHTADTSVFWVEIFQLGAKMHLSTLTPVPGRFFSFSWL